MNVSRRQFVASAAVASAAAASAVTLPDTASARADFPWASKETYLNTATEHPLVIHSARAMEEYLKALTQGPDSARDKFENGHLMGDVKKMFAQLINAKPSEIAFTPSTQTGENIVLEGLDVMASGNVVTNDLHYDGSLLNYRERKKQGLDVRIVAHKDYVMDFRDIERVVDRKTKLIAIALVSNVNGYLHEIRKISDLAHANGAYVYADAIQAAGAIPIDVQAMGIDFLACSAYKWLMGGRFGYLYVREDLQGGALKAKLFGGRSTPTGASRYEISTCSHLGCVCQYEALRYIHRFGVERIRAHVRPLTDRLQEEMPALGYPTITPKGNDSSIVSFTVRDGDAAKAKLKKAKIVVTLGSYMRVSPSLFNNLSDVDRLLETLG
jgi:selenocysteine lyase/cysteine desulfurase